QTGSGICCLVEIDHMTNVLRVIGVTPKSSEVKQPPASTPNPSTANGNVSNLGVIANQICPLAHRKLLILPSSSIAFSFPVFLGRGQADVSPNRSCPRGV
ncbi:hypothetical protein ABG768_027488, partial [Culter alburnus]